MAMVIIITVLVLPSYALASPGDAALVYIEKHSKQFDEDLLQLGAIPSIASMPKHADDVNKAADWLVKRLKKAGLKVKIPCIGKYMGKQFGVST
jgi:hypothetical protein